MMRVCRALLMTALCAPWLAASAVAGPLEPQACASLKSEHDGLASAGAQSDMDRGPEWAKTNLAPDKLQKVERLIALKEQLTFRCGLALTAKPALKEPPPEAKEKGGAKRAGAMGLSSIPPPKRKNATAASQHKSKSASQ